MKELMGGDFKESRYKDLAGRPFVKFKDFVMDAEKRGKVQIFTNGTVNEVFLPGEDPYKLSQFAADLEKVAEALASETAVNGNGNGKEPALPVAEAAQPASNGPNGRRRRRRSRGGRGSAAHRSEATNELQELQELEGDEVFEAPEGVDPITVGDDELLALAALEEPAEIDQISEEQFAEELAAARLSDVMNSVAEAMLAANYEQRDDEDEVFVADGEDDLFVDLAIEELPEAAFFDEPEYTAPDAEEVAESASVAEEGEVVAEGEPEEEAAPEAEAVAEPEAAEEAAPEAEAVAEAEVVEEAAPVGAGTVDQPGPESAAEAVAPAEATAEAPAATTEPDQAEADGEDATPAEDIHFTDAEWVVFRTMMTGFSKPASFQQIFDTLRGVRKDQQLTRTNEQLRSMVKQAINSGVLERSGRGKRIYYQLRTTEE
jgi:hypothetical protein